MKKILLFLFLAMPLMGFAQKSYVTVYAVLSNGNENCYIRLSGDIPPSMKKRYDGKDFDGTEYYYGYNYIGSVLNILAKNGYSVEQMNSLSSSTSKSVISTFLLSKPSDDSATPSKIQNIKTEDEGEPYEVARYNLQGIPVKANEKGVQIIVFSNYTTKTVVVE